MSCSGCSEELFWLWHLACACSTLASLTNWSLSVYFWEHLQCANNLLIRSSPTPPSFSREVSPDPLLRRQPDLPARNLGWRRSALGRDRSHPILSAKNLCPTYFEALLVQNSPLVGQSQTASISQSYPEKEGTVPWNNRFELVNVWSSWILHSVAQYCMWVAFSSVVIQTISMYVYVCFWQIGHHSRRELRS